MPCLRWCPINNWLIAWRTTTTLLSSFAAAGRQTDADDRELLKSAVNHYHVNWRDVFCMCFFVCRLCVGVCLCFFFVNFSFLKGRGGTNSLKNVCETLILVFFSSFFISTGIVQWAYLTAWSGRWERRLQNLGVVGDLQQYITMQLHLYYDDNEFVGSVQTATTGF
jgi:hypothetical protein